MEEHLQMRAEVPADRMPSTIPKTSDRNDLYGALAELVISAASILLLRKRKAEKNCSNMM